MTRTDPLALFEENQKLAMYFLWRHYPALAQDEDIQQEALLGMSQAHCSRILKRLLNEYKKGSV